MHAKLASLAKLIGAPCEARIGKRARAVVVFDWDRLTAKSRAAFLDDIFGDLDDPKAFAGVVAQGDRGVTWLSTRLVPFALAGVAAGETKFRGGDDYPQFEQLLLADVGAAGVPVHAIEVDGTAIAARTPKKLGTLAALALAAPEQPTSARAAKPAAKQGGLRKLAMTFQMHLGVYWMSRKAADLKKAEQALAAFERAFAGSPEAAAKPTRSVAQTLRGLLDKVRATPESYRAAIPRFQKLFATLA